MLPNYYHQISDKFTRYQVTRILLSIVYKKANIWKSFSLEFLPPTKFTCIKSLSKSWRINIFISFEWNEAEIFAPQELCFDQDKSKFINYLWKESFFGYRLLSYLSKFLIHGDILFKHKRVTLNVVDKIIS